jgi:hypothetical protein
VQVINAEGSEGCVEIFVMGAKQESEINLELLLFIEIYSYNLLNISNILEKAIS